MKVKKEPSWEIDVLALGSRDKPITVEDDEEQLISIENEGDDEDVICLDTVPKNVSNSLHNRSGVGNDLQIISNTSDKTGNDLPLNNIPGPSSTNVHVETQEFRYFHNPMFKSSSKESSMNEKTLNISPPIMYTAGRGKRHPGTHFSKPNIPSCTVTSESQFCGTSVQANEIFSDNISVNSYEKPFVPKVDSFFPPPPRPQSFTPSFDPSHHFSTTEDFDIGRKWKRPPSTATQDSFTSDALRRPHYLPTPSSCSTSEVSSEYQPNFNFRNDNFGYRNENFRHRNENFGYRNDRPRKQYPPRVQGSVDVFVIHRDDRKRRVTSEDLDILNNYLGQCMFEESEKIDFFMGFEYKKITNGQAQFNCSNKQMAIWTIDKILKFTEMPMKTSLKNMQPRVNAFMWFNNLPHLGDNLPKMSEVLRGLVKCNPGFESHFKITVIRVTKQKHRLGRFFFQIMVDQELLAYLKAQMKPPFMRVCVLKYYNVKVFFKERG